MSGRASRRFAGRKNSKSKPTLEADNGPQNLDDDRRVADERCESSPGTSSRSSSDDEVSQGGLGTEELEKEADKRRARGIFTRAEVAAHNTEDDCWIICKGVVYDVTRHIPEHPGGKNSILKKAGKDCTEDFGFHSSQAKKLWKSMRVGELVASESPKKGCCVM